MNDDALPSAPSRATSAGTREGGRPWVDYSHEARVIRNPLLRGLFIALGWLCVASGAIGVVLPGWPTTIWIIVATYFFARSSPRFYNWVMNHRVFGPLIRDWRDGKGMTARAKTVAVTTIVLTISVSIAVIPVVWVKALLLTIMVILCTYLLRLPTKPAEATA
ncbi:MAG: YbaN family protein [Trueperaceae bacterium]|nr:YbaN family protein [Trueperaceae bacterium]